MHIYALYPSLEYNYTKYTLIVMKLEKKLFPLPIIITKNLF